MAIESLHNNRNPKTESGTKDWSIVVIGLTMFLFGGIRALGVWIREAVECFK